MFQDTTATSYNSQLPENLIEDLSDEELAVAIGGCDIQINAGEQEITVPLIELPLLGESYVNLGLVSADYDPNGSARYESWRR